MLRSINQADSVYILPQSHLAQSEGSSNSQISYNNNPSFAGKPSYDSFIKAKPLHANPGGNPIGFISMVAGTILSIAVLHKRPNVLKGKQETILKETKRVGKNFLTKAKNFIFKKTSPATEKVTSKASEVLHEAEHKAQRIFSESTSSDAVNKMYGENSLNRVPKSKFRRTIKAENKFQNHEKEITGKQKQLLNPKSDYRRASEDIYKEIEEESVNYNDVEAFRKTLGDQPTKAQRRAIKRNNAKAQEVSAKARQIEANIPEEVAEKLRNLANPAAKPAAKVTKPVAEVAKPVVKAAKPVANATKPIVKTATPKTAAKGKVRINSKFSKTSVKPEKLTKKPLRTNDLQTRILEQVNPKAASEIKGVEGNIKRLEQRIKGAELMQKDTKTLKKELEHNQKKLTKLKSEALEAVPNAKPTSKKVAKVETNPMAQTSDINVQYMTEKAKNNMQMIHNNASEKSKPVKSVHDLASIPFKDMPGKRDAAGVIRQYDEHGALQRIIKDKGHGLVECKEISRNNPNGTTYFLRDGVMIKKSEIGQQSEYMHRLVNRLDGVSEQSEITKIIDSFADKCGMKKVNETIMLEGQETKIIYKGFNYDITEDGRVLSKRFGATGKAYHSDATPQLSKKTRQEAKRVKMYPEETPYRYMNMEPMRKRA